MRILVVNCNTSDDVTADIDAGARRAASPGTEIRTVQPAWGPSSAEGFLESFMTAAAVIERVAHWCTILSAAFIGRVVITRSR